MFTAVLLALQLLLVSAQTPNSCQYAYDYVCDEPQYCDYGTDTADCSSSSYGHRRRRSSSSSSSSTGEMMGGAGISVDGECNLNSYPQIGLLDNLIVGMASAAFWCLIGLLIVTGVCLFLSLVVLCRYAYSKSPGGFLTPAITSYFGLVYLLLIVTVPLFGKPTNWKKPGLPHFSPRFDDDKFSTVVSGFFINGFAMIAVPYAAFLLMILVIGVCLLTPVLSVALLALVQLCRFADLAADKILKLEQNTVEQNAEKMSSDKADKGQSNHEGLPYQLFRFILQFFSCVLPAVLIGLRWGVDLWMIVSVWSIAFPEWNLEFPFFFGIPLPCFRFPSWNMGCTITHTLELLLLLSGCIGMFTVFVSADVLTMIFDRVARAQQFKLKIWNEEDRKNGALESNMMQILVLIAKEALWKCVEIVVAMGSALVVQIWQTQLMMGDHNICSIGLALASWVLSLYFTMVLVMNVARIGTGTLHGNMLFVLARPLVEHEVSLFSWDQIFHRLVPIVKITLGTSLFPFVPVMNQPKGEEEFAEVKAIIIQEDEEKARKSFSERTASFQEKRKTELESASDRHGECCASCKSIKHSGFLKFYKLFNIEQVVWSTLAMLHQSFEKKDDLHPLQVGGANIEDHFLPSLQKTLREKLFPKNLAAVLGTMFGYWPHHFLLSHWVLPRSQMWQSQIEAIQQANGNYYGLALQTIPIIGILMGKVTMYLNEHPALIITEDKDLRDRSFRDTEKSQKLSPDCQLLGLFLCSFVKVGLLMVAFHFITAGGPGANGSAGSCWIVVFCIALFEELIKARNAEKAKKPMEHYLEKNRNCEASKSDIGADSIVPVPVSDPPVGADDIVLDTDPDNSPAEDPNTSAAKDPDTSAAKDPETSAAKDPDTPAAKDPDTSAAKDPDTDSDHHAI